MRAFIFPGQASQIIGMGKDFYDNFQAAKETFQTIDETLKYKLTEIIFNGPDYKLTDTLHAQPAIMAVSMAILNSIKTEFGKEINDFCSYVAGHSLGEYSALCAVKSISLEDVTLLLHERAKAMKEASSNIDGSMLAIIDAPLSEIEDMITVFREACICAIANDNIEGQIVVSAEKQVIEQMQAIMKDIGYKSIQLKVSGAFHCDLMKSAEEKMKLLLNQVSINTPIVPIIQNFTANETSDTIVIRDSLISQICGRVRWRETLNYLEKKNVTELYEIGPSKILKSMIEKSEKKFKTFNISTIRDVNKFF
jgi:[acyl-carrier-protein] S-malonyltransferase